jgi:stage V sporulation protein G
VEITDVKVKLVEDRSDKLLAFCTITIHRDFVIRDLKIIDGPKGAFVAMPSRKLTDRCPRCGGKNHRLAKFCNSCGGKLSEHRNRKSDGSRARLHADIAHPITSDCREFVQDKVLSAYREEVERSKEEGYVAPDLDADFLEDDREVTEKEEAPRKGRRPPRSQKKSAPRPPEPAKPPPPPPPPPPVEESEDNFSSGIFR